MFGARGLSLGLGGVNLSDLNNLRSANAAAQHRLHLQRRRASRIGGDGAAGGVVDAESRRRDSATSSPTTSTSKLKRTATTILRRVGDSSPLMEPAKKKTRIVVKKSLDRSTFWSVCRALIFGIALIALGVAMCTIGYYKEYFATELVGGDQNRSVAVVNYSTRLQFESLSYIGPCIMGCGMFVLMVACVMTLEGRDLNTQIYTRRSPSKRSSTRRSAASHRTETEDDGEIVNPPPTEHIDESLGDKQISDDKQEGADNNNKLEANIGDEVAENKRDSDQRYERVAGAKSQKTTSTKINSPHADSEHVAAITAALTTTTKAETSTERKNASARSRKEDCSASTRADVAKKKIDSRVLLQRFLEDQSRLVDDRMRRMHMRNDAIIAQRSTTSPGVSYKNVDVNYQQQSKRSVVADVHHSVDARSPKSIEGAQIHRINYGTRAPIASAEPSEIFGASPMSFTPDAPVFSDKYPPTASSNGYLSVMASPSPSMLRRPRCNSKRGSQLSLSSYTTVKSHLSCSSNNACVISGCGEDSPHRTLPGHCVRRPSDVFNGNSNDFSNNQPYYFDNAPTQQLFVMNNTFSSNCIQRNSPREQPLGAEAKVDSGELALNMEDRTNVSRVYSLSYSPAVTHESAKDPTNLPNRKRTT